MELIAHMYRSSLWFSPVLNRRVPARRIVDRWIQLLVAVDWVHDLGRASAPGRTRSTFGTSEHCESRRSTTASLQSHPARLGTCRTPPEQPPHASPMSRLQAQSLGTTACRKAAGAPTSKASRTAASRRLDRPATQGSTHHLAALPTHCAVSARPADHVADLRSSPVACGMLGWFVELLEAPVPASG